VDTEFILKIVSQAHGVKESAPVKIALAPPTAVCLGCCGARPRARAFHRTSDKKLEYLSVF
jgi:hypothetical protein